MSTAFELSQQGYTNISVFEKDSDIPSRWSAANDLNKIMRVEYEDPWYTELGVVGPLTLINARLSTNLSYRKPRRNGNPLCMRHISIELDTSTASQVQGREKQSIQWSLSRLLVRHIRKLSPGSPQYRLVRRSETSAGSSTRARCQDGKAISTATMDMCTLPMLSKVSTALRDHVVFVSISERGRVPSRKSSTRGSG